MYKKQQGQLTFSEHILYQKLPEDILAKINSLINWKPFEKILAKLHPLYVCRRISKQMRKIEGKVGKGWLIHGRSAWLISGSSW